MALVGRCPRVQVQHKDGPVRPRQGDGPSPGLVTPIRAPRAERGTRTVAVRCGACGDEVSLRIFGLRAARRARLAWLLAVLAAALATLVLICLLLAWPGPQSGPDFALRLFGGYAAAGCVIVALIRFHHEDGVRLSWHPTLSHERHSLTR